MRITGLRAVTLTLAVVLLGACAGADDYYVVGSDEMREEQRELLALYREAEGSPADQVVLAERIAGRLMAAGYQSRVPAFLTTHVERRPADPYNAYYLVLTAEAYRNEGFPQLAQQYFERAVVNFPDVVVRDRSVHLSALQELVRLTQEPQRRIRHYEELVARFPDEVDRGLAGYYMGKSYEELGDWDSAIASYRQFLRDRDATVPGAPDARERVAEMIEFHDSAKNWTFASLDDLVYAIKVAIDSRDPQRLLSYRAGVNFFSMSWGQEESDENSEIEWEIGELLSNSVRYNRTLDIGSNEKEAYLRTTGWGIRIQTWYLYFRRIDFPADPDINGNWEWAGILFGERL